MASANLDLVRSIYAAWERGDYSSSEWADAEIEYVQADGLSPGRWTGVAGMAHSVRGWLNAWQDFRIEAEGYIELDSERVLVLTSFSGRGKTSGLELGQMRSSGANLFHIHGGKVTRRVLYFDCECAFADLGLAPEAGAP
jgi:ketosteroid isomerase-like protein